MGEDRSRSLGASMVMWAHLTPSLIDLFEEVDCEVDEVEEECALDYDEMWQDADDDNELE